MTQVTTNKVPTTKVPNQEEAEALTNHPLNGAVTRDNHPLNQAQRFPTQGSNKEA
jgi:hypothetical protein